VQKIARELAGNLGPAGHVVVAAGDHDAGVAAGLATGLHEPAGTRRPERLDSLDRSARRDVAVEPEMLGVGLEVFETLPVIGIGRKMPGHLWLAACLAAVSSFLFFVHSP